MVTGIIGILETAAVTLSGFLAKKYVLLEPDMETKKMRIFYVIGFFLIVGVFFAFGKDAAIVATGVLIGLNICLVRKKHRLLGLFLMIPLMGIINGLLMPIIRVPPYLLSLSVQGTLIYQVMVYGVLFALLILFYYRADHAGQ